MRCISGRWAGRPRLNYVVVMLVSSIRKGDESAYALEAEYGESVTFSNGGASTLVILQQFGVISGILMLL